MAIRMWLASRGFGPVPSEATAAEPTGSHEDAEQNPLATSVHRANGFAAVAIKPNQKTDTAPITASAPRPRPSPRQVRRHTSKENTESRTPQSTTLPSSAAQPDANRNTNGVCNAEFWAT